jgi:nicotinate-nucleotide pyrophosphorylase (carboxylating)
MDKLSQQLIRLAYTEDIGGGDITSELTVGKRLTGQAMIVAKSAGVFSGSEPFRYAFRLASPKVKINMLIKDGQRYKPGKKLASITGPAQALLKGERLVLNLISHLSGVATLTSLFVAKVKGTQATVLDTRKTMPGMRLLEKQAVAHGGGRNHRIGLYDMILIKDNHIAAAGGIANALKRTAKAKCKVEIEVADLRQLREALEYSPDIIMLDNFTPAMIKKAVAIVKATKPKIKIEVSGGVNLKTVREYALAGVDFISVGALTHSAPAADFSMRYIL